MSILAWIVLGLIAGFISSLIVNRRGEGFFLDIVVGVVGALIGGFVMSAVGSEGITGLNLWSILVAIGGAIVLLVILHAIRGTPRTGTY
ncbi:MAG: GlsB/YeaQ/YmgE family stress response membrane protein [Alphaproteobacteria bacterium]|nr:GlsB/YeaQ/YmgE family stress response membrane protein [Alphaproteobacteria bacterium]MBV9152948.1 GlsB/YeaQ/YmgE family stress response membrane protein [Alphaproteobacteria bacterium]MBV9968061.1 GlsB/YeaQ/YmgE family stress response membrane protein [Alphaproteobacteria bacterium]